MPDNLPLQEFQGFYALPFKIHPVSSQLEMEQVLALRHSAYGRHDYRAELVSEMPRPDSLDTAGYSTTLVAVEKTSGALIGTVRLTCNADGPAPLPPDLPLAPCLQGVYAYLDRFAVAAEGDNRIVAPALIKAMWLWALGRDARMLLALARAPLARRYQRWGGLVLKGQPEGFHMDEYHAEPYFLVGAGLGEAAVRCAQDNPKFGIEFTGRMHSDIRVQGCGASWADFQPGTPVSEVPNA